MIYQSPLFGIPYYKDNRNHTYKDTKAYMSPKHSPIKESKKASNKERPQKEKKSSDRSTEDSYFELLGIRLYFDDLLILALLFFLYNEGVKDQVLFISLILLLLS